MYADHVICNNCNRVMIVILGTDICPKCKMVGTLTWKDEKNPEIEARLSEVINLDFPDEEIFVN